MQWDFVTASNAYHGALYQGFDAVCRTVVRAESKRPSQGLLAWIGS